MITEGSIVHVRDESAEVCRPAIVVVVGAHASEVAGDLRLRVLYPAPITEPAGSRDAENWYPHRSERLSATNPDGTHRWLDSWHEISEDPV